MDRGGNGRGRGEGFAWVNNVHLQLFFIYAHTVISRLGFMGFVALDIFKGYTSTVDQTKLNNYVHVSAVLQRSSEPVGTIES